MLYARFQSCPKESQLVVILDMQKRITEMLKHADAFIFLPGDLATLEALITLHLGHI